jgi:hypothetical protein
MIRALFLFLPLFIGCDVNNGSSPEGDCTDHGQCGEMQACIENSCTDVECLSSSDCPLHNFCDKELNRYACNAGCEGDDDCVAGEECHEDYGTCEEYDCRETDLDCEYMENCVNGECRADTSGHCQPCDPTDWFDPCFMNCFYLDENTTDGYCLQDCRPQDEEACPRGFECAETTMGTHVCYAYCPWLEEHGYL